MLVRVSKNAFINRAFPSRHIFLWTLTLIPAFDPPWLRSQLQTLIELNSAQISVVQISRETVNISCNTESKVIRPVFCTRAVHMAPEPHKQSSRGFFPGPESIDDWPPPLYCPGIVFEAVRDSSRRARDVGMKTPSKERDLVESTRFFAQLQRYTKGFGGVVQLHTYCRCRNAVLDLVPQVLAQQTVPENFEPCRLQCSRR